MRAWLGLLPLAAAMGQAPSFHADRVLPPCAGQPATLFPGMLISIYGENLGPAPACTASPDPSRAGRYPTQVCSVQVSLAGRSAGLLYVSDKQINFQVPQDSQAEGEVELRVMYRGLAGTATVRAGFDSAALSVEGEARVGGPVWIRVQAPPGWGIVQYPVRTLPADFGCSEFEVRRDGTPLPRIAFRPPEGGISLSGPPCGHLAMDRPIPHTGRLPLHLQYRFTEPGLYEIRYTQRRMGYPAAEAPLRSEWTVIEVLAPAAGPRASRPAPAEPGELLGDYLPGLLGFSDSTALDAVVACLYHQHPTVRQFAVNALGYWSKAEAEARVDRELAVRGPSDMTVEGTLARHPEMLPLVLGYLRSADPSLLRGAVTGVARWIYAHPAHSGVETGFLAAAEHVIQAADEQTVTDYAAALGGVRDPRAGSLLWDLVARRVARGQALIAICWRKDARDLPLLERVLEAPAIAGPNGSGESSLPYAMHNAYGSQALTYLESALKKSGHMPVRINCARELIQAGRPAGFAFAARAIEEKASYARDITQFVRDRFPELQGADERTVLSFLQKHSLP
jgi:hypothetical protein